MQNAPRDTAADSPKIADGNCSSSSSSSGSAKAKAVVNVVHDEIVVAAARTAAATATAGNSTTATSSSSSAPEEAYSDRTSSSTRRYMTDSSESDEDSVSEDFEDNQIATAKFLLNPDEERNVDPETQTRLEALLQAADEAAAALTRMRSDNPARVGGGQQQPSDKSLQSSLVEACTDGDVGTVRKLLTEGRSVHETSEEGESLLSLACSAGYYELAQVLLAMHANVEDRGAKGECTPLMEAASAGHLDIVRLLVKNGADVNAQSTSGNTPLMYGCAGGHTDCVRFLLEHGANVEDHNENGHTPLMEAASAGHVGLARILLQHGAGINTHSNEFKESALTLACYKGHLDMVRFLLEAGADQEHKTDEMHTALMEASMDGHVEVARLLLDSGAQVNMPTDSFESPLTLAACGGHVDLAMLLIERGANIEEVNDEGYTPLMEAAREGHEEMVHLLLSQGANINAQTDETQETALTLACCGGFTEVADILLKGGADIELGASTPLMEAAQEGHLDLVKFLLENAANVHAQTQTGDTALTYACENGHTDVADILLQYGADLEHESEGGRTPLMKACRAGHSCTVNYLILKGGNVRRQTTNNDHTPLSLACAGGHIAVVEMLLNHNADPCHKLKDSSTMLIEAAKGGHTNVVQMLLDYPHSVQHMQSMINQHHQQQQQQQQQQGQATVATNLSMLPGQIGGSTGGSSSSGTNSRDSPLSIACTSLQPGLPGGGAVGQQQQQQQQINFFQPPPTAAVLQEVPEAVRIVSQTENPNDPNDPNKLDCKHNWCRMHLLLTKSRSSATTTSGSSTMYDGTLTSAEAQQVRTQPLAFSDFEVDAAMEYVNKEDSLVEFMKSHKKPSSSSTDDGSTQKQQILEELHRVERELHGKTASSAHSHVFQYAVPQDQCSSSTLPHMLNIDIAMQQQQQQVGLGSSIFPTSSLGGANNLQVQNAFYTGGATGAAGVVGGAAQGTSSSPLKAISGGVADLSTTFIQTSQQQQQQQPAFYFTPLSTSVSLPTNATTSAAANQQPIKFQSVASEVSQSTAISDRPKAKPVSKKEGKLVRKQQLIAQQFQSSNVYSPPPQVFSPIQLQQQHQFQQQQQQQQLADQDHLHQQMQQQVLQQPLPQQQPTAQQLDQIVQDKTSLTLSEALNVQGLDLDALDQDTLVLKDDGQDNLLATASLLQQFQNTSMRAAFVGSPQKTQLDLYDPKGVDLKDDDLEKSFEVVDDVDVVETLEAFSQAQDIEHQNQHNLQVQPYGTTLEDSIVATFTGQELQNQIDLPRVEYFAVPTPTNGSQVPVHTIYPYEHYLTAAGMPNKEAQSSGAIYQAGFQAGINLMQQQLACPAIQASASPETSPVTTVAVPSSPSQVGTSPQQPQQQTQFVTNQQQQSCCAQMGPCGHLVSAVTAAAAAMKPTPAFAEHSCQGICTHHQQQQQQQQVVAAHQQQQQQQQSHQVQAATQTLQTTEPKKSKISTDGAAASGTSGSLGMKLKKGRVVRHQNNQNQNFQQNQNNYQAADPNSTAITQYNGAAAAAAAATQQQINNSLTCLDVDSKTDSNHDTALTLACAGGHEELVDLLLNRGADMEHRDKKGFTPLILAATAGHEKVVDVLLNHNAEIEAQSERTKDTPLSLACSGGRYEVVDLLLQRNANKEHRNVSDYTPLSLAASGGYVNIIKLLLNSGAEINSRTGSKLGISPLMLAAMNGHTAAVKLLLDMGSDINAQIETNRNTALTLACFQGRHEVVSLLLDRKANVEHRAKTGLTPLMEAASGGYVEVGRVLLDKGADVNAPPVPSSRDTALTIAADKGHVRFVELLLVRGAQVEVKNKKGNSPLWLAANGGHLQVVELLFNIHADIDSQDNRKVSCLMAAFRKGHVKVVKWMVTNVQQYPSDQEMVRYISTVSDKELLDKCNECVKIIRAAKETQAKKAFDNASSLLAELDIEKNREESKRQAAARRRERKKKKKLEKKEEKRKLLQENLKNENYDEDDKENKKDGGDKTEDDEPMPEVVEAVTREGDKEEGDSGIDANSQGSCSSNDIQRPTSDKRKDKKKKKSNQAGSKSNAAGKAGSSKDFAGADSSSDSKRDKDGGKKSSSTPNFRKGIVFEASTKSPADRDDFEATGNENYVSTSAAAASKSKKFTYDSVADKTTSPKTQSSKREEGWKEVVRKSSVQAVSSEPGVKKVSVPSNAISRVIGRGGSNINAIRAATGAHIEVEKQSKGQGERIITIKGTPEITKHANNLITTLIKEPDVDILQLLPKNNKAASTAPSLWDKTQMGVTKKVAGKSTTIVLPPYSSSASQVIQSKSSSAHQSSGGGGGSASHSSPLCAIQASATPRSSASAKPRSGIVTMPSSRVAPRLQAQAEKHALAAATATVLSHVYHGGGGSSSSGSHPTTATSRTATASSSYHPAGSAILNPVSSSSSSSSSGRIATKTITTMSTQTFAAKLSSETSAAAAAAAATGGAGSNLPTAAASSSSGRGSGHHGGSSSSSNQHHEQLSVNVGSGSHGSKGRSLAPPSVGSAGPVSPQQQQGLLQSTAVASNPLYASPKHSRPTPTASAPPNMQHYQSPGKTSVFGGSATASESSQARSSTPQELQSSRSLNERISVIQPPQNRPSATTVVDHHDDSSNVVQQQSHKQQQDHHAQLQQQQQQQHQQQQQQTSTITSGGMQTRSNEYSLFSTGDQSPMWSRRDESQKVNFAVVTGGGGVGNPQPQSQPQFQEPPPLVDAKKAPGYRGGTAACSPVSSKASSSSTTPPGSSYRGETSYSSGGMSSIGTTLGRVQQQQQQQQQNENNTSSGRDAYYPDMFKTVGGASSANIPHSSAGGGASGGGMMNMGGGPESAAAHLLQTSYYQHHQNSSVVAAAQQQQQQQQQIKNLSGSNSGGYSVAQQQQQQQQQLPLVSMSRLNPKAPDFSSTSSSVHMQGGGLPGGKQQPNQMYNGYPMGSGGGGGNQTGPIYSTGHKSGMDHSYHRSAGSRTHSAAAQQAAVVAAQWNFMTMQQQPALTPQQTEYISGMTVHGIARVAGGESMVDPSTGVDLSGGGNHHSPNMSPSGMGAAAAHGLHVSSSGGGGGGPDSGVHYLDEGRKAPAPPQPIGTERARKSASFVQQAPPPASMVVDPGNWMAFDKPTQSGGGGRWPAGAPDSYAMSGRVNQVFQEDLPQHLIDTFQTNMALGDATVYSNATQLPTYMLPQQTIGSHRSHEMIPADNIHWDVARSQMNEIQDKPHGWTGMSNKWNL